MKILIFDCHKNKLGESKKIGRALTMDKEIEIDYVEARKFEFPEINEYNAFVVSGADASSDKHAWVRKLKEVLQGIIDLDKPLLGVCYGSQLIGSLYGLEVVELETPEVGWKEVQLTELGKQDPLFKDIPETFPVFEHHIRAVDTHENVLAKNDNCIQSIKYKENVYGIQFHAEESPESGTKYLETDPHCESFEEATKLKPENYIEWKVFRNFAGIVKNVN